MKRIIKKTISIFLVLAITVTIITFSQTEIKAMYDDNKYAISDVHLEVMPEDMTFDDAFIMLQDNFLSNTGIAGEMDVLIQENEDLAYYYTSQYQSLLFKVGVQITEERSMWAAYYKYTMDECSYYDKYEVPYSYIYGYMKRIGVLTNEATLDEFIGYIKNIRYNYYMDVIVEADNTDKTREEIESEAIAEFESIREVERESYKTEEESSKLAEESKDTTTVAEITTTKKVSNVVNISKQKVKQLKLKKSKKNIKISWKKIKAVKGYQVRYAANKKFRKAITKTIKKNKNTYNIKKYKKKKIYVKVRAYVSNGKKKTYSKWSKVKSIKIK